MSHSNLLILHVSFTGFPGQTGPVLASVSDGGAAVQNQIVPFRSDENFLLCFYTKVFSSLITVVWPVAMVMDRVNVRQECLFLCGDAHRTIIQPVSSRETRRRVPLAERSVSHNKRHELLTEEWREGRDQCDYWSSSQKTVEYYI